MIAAVAIALVGLLATGTHVIRRGETLGRIASEHGVSIGELARANGIADPNRIIAGHTLTIPGGSATPTGPSSTGTTAHTIRPGETLSRIAARYGVTVRALAQANRITNIHRIIAGARLVIGGGSAPDTAPAGTGATHVVRRGDTLSHIAGMHGVTVGELARANGITDRNFIRVGRSLVVPGPGPRCPVPGSSFTDTWGAQRSGGRSHEGTDLFAGRGAPVRAPVPGRVAHVEGSRGGLQFYLYGTDGVLYIGTHLDSFGASGQVRAGDVVGTVGTSGNAAGTPPHLHFEILPDGRTPTNPYPILAAACR